MSVPSLTAQVQGQGTLSADQINTFLQGCVTLSQLRAFIGLPTMQVMVTGINTAGDGGGGAFYWNATATGTDDNYSFIVPQPNVPGAWLRVPTISTVQNFSCVDTGTVNAMVGAFTPPITTYVDGQIYNVKPKFTNTGSATFNGGGGALSVTGPAGVLQGGEIVSEQWLGIQYSAVNGNFLIVSGWGNTQGLAATQSEHFVTKSQIGGNYAALAGSSTQVFSAAPGTTGNEVVNNSQFSVTSSEATFPGGLVIQYGSFTATQNGGGTINFAQAFPTQCFAVIATPGGTGTTNSTFVISGHTATGFTWGWPATASNSESVSYLAIGN